jgi:Ser-tRNA(Ala) deacylase AlaX
MSKTKQIFLDDPYLYKLNGKIISINKEDDLFVIILNQTIFHPQGI